MFVLSILFVSKSFGMASNASLMYVAVRVVCFGGFLLSKPSKVLCARFVRRVVVKWFDLHPCWGCVRL